MYSGELEVQAKRKVLALLHDETNKILNSARELSLITQNIINEDKKGINECLDRMNALEEDVENLRRKLTVDVAEIGSLMVYREDILRTAYIMDDIAGYIGGVAFRLANINTSLKELNFDTDLKDLVDFILESIFKLNEMARALSINPSSTFDLAQEVQKIERRVDSKYRSVIIKAFNELPYSGDLLLLKDAIEGIEGIADKCQEASDTFIILALSM